MPRPIPLHGQTEEALLDFDALVKRLSPRDVESRDVRASWQIVQPLVTRLARTTRLAAQLLTTAEGIDSPTVEDSILTRRATRIVFARPEEETERIRYGRV